MVRFVEIGGIYLALSLVIAGCALAQHPDASPIPAGSGQMVLVLSGSFDASSGTLWRFERDSSGGSWAAVGGATPITLGRNGLGLGAGLHRIDPGSMPVKKEGDGKSPAGVFHLSAAFGYAPLQEMGALKVPYTRVTDRLECVDDVNSSHYNQIVSRDEVDDVDWTSSEQMLMDGVWYETGIVVDHNTNPAKPGAGSCIFLHNWSGPDDTTAGCTAMAPPALTELVQWLDSTAGPVLVQLTDSLYAEYRDAWGLPGPFPIEN
jgi:D-alanyl-D-alanine dipeptidase